MFGNKPDLILPITLDIANLVKTAGSQKPYKFKDRHQTPKNQLVRRNFVLYPKKEVPSVSYHDDRYTISSSKIRRTRETNSQNQNDDKSNDRTARVLYINSHPEYLTPSNTQPLTDSDRSYHERKLNMTAFTGIGDQIAMPSHQIFQVAKPEHYPIKSNIEYNSQNRNEYANTNNGQMAKLQGDANMLSYYSKQNLTLEQIENLAFAGLNSSSEIPNAIQTDDDMISSYENNSNSTMDDDDESLPTPEKLIMMRFRPKISNKISAQSYRRRRPTSTAYEMANCEKFGNLCLKTPEYPM